MKVNDDDDDNDDSINMTEKNIPSAWMVVAN